MSRFLSDKDGEILCALTQREIENLPRPLIEELARYAEFQSMVNQSEHRTHLRVQRLKNLEIQAQNLRLEEERNEEDFEAICQVDLKIARVNLIRREKLIKDRFAALPEPEEESPLPAPQTLAQGLERLSDAREYAQFERVTLGMVKQLIRDWAILRSYIETEADDHIRRTV